MNSARGNAGAASPPVPSEAATSIGWLPSPPWSRAAFEEAAQPAVAAAIPTPATNATAACRMRASVPPLTHLEPPTFDIDGQHMLAAPPIASKRNAGRSRCPGARRIFRVLVILYAGGCRVLARLHEE